MIKKISNWIDTHKCIVATYHINIWIFEEFGFAILIDLSSIYILLGFVGINIFFRK